MSGERRTGAGRARTVVAVATVALATAALAVVPGGRAGASSVIVTAGSGTGAKGSEVRIPVTFAGGPKVGAVEAVVTYDPKVLQALGADRGAIASNAQIESKAGEGRLAIALISSDGVAGNGEIAVARFTVLGEKGATSALTLTDTTVWEAEGDGFVVQVATQNGTFSVSGKKAAFPLWIVAVAAAVVLLFLLLLLTRRRRRGGEPPTAAVAAAPAPPPAPPVASTPAASTPAASTPAASTPAASTPPVAPPVTPPPAAPPTPPAPPPAAPAAPPAAAETPGASDGEQESFCPNCGTPRKPGAHFCAKCGNRMA